MVLQESVWVTMCQTKTAKSTKLLQKPVIPSICRRFKGHRDRYIGSLFRVDEPVPVLPVQTVDISNDRQFTLF